MDDALLLEGVSKRYADHLAVDGLSMRIPRGTIYGLLGPNGAGKSTTIRMVMNVLGRDGGRIALLGVDPERDRSVLRRVGYLPEERGLYKKMKALDVVVFFAELKGMRPAEARRDAERWLERMGLGEWRHAKVETLSKGMQQKLQFVATILHRPDVLILDEPQSGLDPVNQEVLREVLLEVRAAGQTVIFSTHNMEQAEQMCESVCIIANGRKVLDGELRAIKRAGRGNRFRVEIDAGSEGGTDKVERLLAGTPEIGSAARDGDGWVVDLAAAADTRPLVAAIHQLGLPLVRLERVEPSLHDIFLRSVGADAVRQERREVAHG